MRSILIYTLWLIFCSGVWADDLITFKSDEVKAKPGRYFVVIPECDDDLHVEWFYPEHFELSPFELRNPRALCVSTEQEGTFRVGAYTAVINDGGMAVPSKVYWCKVIVGDGKPKPDIPPPDPIPPPTALGEELKRLYDVDTTPNKQLHVEALSALYRGAKAVVLNPKMTTSGDLAAKILAAGSSMFPERNMILTIRQRVAEEVAAGLGRNPSAELDSTTRAKAVELFDRIAKALEHAGGIK